MGKIDLAFKPFQHFKSWKEARACSINIILTPGLVAGNHLSRAFSVSFTIGSGHEPVAPTNTITFEINGINVSGPVTVSDPPFVSNGAIGSTQVVTARMNGGTSPIDLTSLMLTGPEASDTVFLTDP